MTIRFLLDENISSRWVEELRNRAWEAVHWSTRGPGAAPDGQVMEHAAVHGLVVITQDLDFGTILTSTGAIVPSVVIVRVSNPRLVQEQLFDALAELTDALTRGALVIVDGPRHRLRLLPIAR